MDGFGLVQKWSSHVKESWEKKLKTGDTLASWFSAATSQQECPGFDGGGPLCVEFACSSHVCEGFLWALWFSPHNQDLDLVPGRYSTAAAHCSAEQDGSNAENKLYTIVHCVHRVYVTNKTSNNNPSGLLNLEL